MIQTSKTEITDLRRTVQGLEIELQSQLSTVCHPSPPSLSHHLGLVNLAVPKPHVRGFSARHSTWPDLLPMPLEASFLA